MSRLPSLGPRGEGWFLIQLGIWSAIFAAGLLGPAWDGGMRVATTLAGLVVGGAGGLLAVRGVADLGESVTPFPHPRANARLVDSGAYALVRHPIYGGLVLGAVGWGLLTASPLVLALVPVLLLFFDLKSRREEAWLEERFPEYDAYRRRTRRIVPWLY